MTTLEEVADRAVEDPIAPPPALERLERRVSRRRTQRRVRVMAPVAAVLVVALGAVSLGRTVRPDDTTVSAGGPASVGETAPDSILVPSTLPEGLALIERDGPDSTLGGESGSPNVDRVRRWVRFDSGGRFPGSTFDVQWQVPGDDLLASISADETTTVHGAQAIVDRGLDDGWRAVAWEEPAGRPVMVSSKQLAAEDLIAIAQSSQQSADGAIDLLTPPTGYEMVAEFPGLVTSGVNRRSVVFAGGGRAVGISMIDDRDTPPGIRFDFNENERVLVRGQTGVLGPRWFENPAPNLDALAGLPPTLMLQWEEGPSLVTIVSHGFTETELQGMAEAMSAAPIAML